MPALPVIANTFRCSIIWSGVGGTNPVNVIHIRATDPPKTASEVANSITTRWDTRMSEVLVSSQECHLIKVTPLDGTSATFDHTGDFPAMTGDQDGQFIPQVAYIAKLITGLRGRSKRGRVFVGPMSEAIANDGQLTPGAALSDLQAGWEAFEAGLVVDGLELVVASYKLSSAQSVTAVSVEQVLATQRRRQSRLRTT
jgi:hypothetical protein